MDPIDDKYKLAQSIREDYLNYSREEAYNLIKSGVFTEDELVNKFNLLTKRAFQHIINYPSRISETEDLPLCYEETVDNLISGNVDVLFFGVCGSGGKTCLMASLMSLIGESADFLYQEFDNDRECDNVYGQYLSNCLKSNRLPPFTPYQYYQVVNTLIKCKGHYKGVSFIEFEGQQVHVLGNQVYALDNTVDLMSCEHLNPSLIKTLNNQNFSR